jgi:hypothetical protein
MTLTFKKLTEYMKNEKAHESVLQERKTEHTIMTKGLELIRGARAKLSDETNISEWDELGDKIEEVEDDGSLEL